MVESRALRLRRPGRTSSASGSWVAEEHGVVGVLVMAQRNQPESDNSFSRRSVIATRWGTCRLASPSSVGEGMGGQALDLSAPFATPRIVSQPAALG